jgi:DNA mismatch repair protein MutS
VDLAQMSLFDTADDDSIIDELKNIEISTMTPIEALNKLNELQSKVKNRW